MPWYKVDLSYGPGHQGHDTTYHYSSELLGEEWEKELIQEAIESNPYARDGAMGRCEMVVALPEDVRRKKVKYYEQVIENARAMLLLLGKES